MSNSTIGGLLNLIVLAVMMVGTGAWFVTRQQESHAAAPEVVYTEQLVTTNGIEYELESLSKETQAIHLWISDKEKIEERKCKQRLPSIDFYIKNPSSVCQD